MCAIEVCRICLKSNIKLYGISEFNLKKYYEELHGELINVNDGLPCCFCYQCAALLHKFHKFKEKSKYSQTKLKNLLRSGPITDKSINNIISTNENVYKCGTRQFLTVTDMVNAFKEVNDGVKDDVIDIKVEVVEHDFDSDHIKTYEEPENDPIAELEQIHKDIMIKEETTEITESDLTPDNIVDSPDFEIKSEVHLELKRKLGQEKENVSSEKDEEYDEVKPKRRQNQKKDEEWVPKRKLRNRPAEINKYNLKSKESKFKEKVCLKHSEESCTTTDERVNVLPKKTRSQNKVWKIVKKFENLDNAYNFVKTENTWSFVANKYTAKGLKKYFRCNKIKRNGPQCSAQVYILGDSSSDEVLLFRTESDHDHSSLKLSSHGLSDQVKQEINKLHDLRLKPKAILENLAKNNSITIPKMTQLRTYLITRRLNKYEPTISLSDLEAWLTAHSTVPDNNHEVYVIGHEIIEGFESPHFRFVLSTKYLLQKASGVNNVHADAAYKLIWQGFSVVIVGSTDKNRKFHPFGLAVLTHEEKDDFKLLFGSIKDNIMTLFSQDFQPEVLVCDATKAMQNAFTEVFSEDVIIRMCWAQAKKKIQEQIVKNTRKEVHKELLSDVDTLQAATDTDTFNIASKLFLKKWEKEVAFVKYFEGQWLTQNRNWYLGVHMGSPATNKALESHNRVIKHECILRARLPLSRFLTVASELVKRWSSNASEGTAENKMFATTPTLNLINWKESYQWAKLPIEVILTQTDEFYRYFEVPAGNTNEIQHFENSWADFNEYKTQFFSKCKVALPCDKDWLNGKCNCPNFYKEYTCKHIIGLAIRFKIVIPPEIAQKGQRGRPKLRPALIIQ